MNNGKMPAAQFDNETVITMMKKLRTYHKPIKGCMFKKVFKTEHTIGDNAYILLENEEDQDLNVCMDFKLDMYELHAPNAGSSLMAYMQQDKTQDCAEFVLESGSRELIKLEGKDNSNKDGGNGGMGGLGGVNPMACVMDEYLKAQRSYTVQISITK